MIPQSFIQDLLNRIDIVDIVGQYVQLKKGGANFMGLCPFHNEKSPSFTVSPSKQFYHCFGCGAHGTAIGFLMEYSGLGFVEAVQEIAQNNGMVVPESNDKIPPAQRAETQAKSLALSDCMTQACDYYRAQLRQAPHAISYLKTRGLSGEIAAKFGLGYAIDAWDGLRAVFADYDDYKLVEAGLVITKAEQDNPHQKRYDRFRDRIMFPIRNQKGQVIGFGGRVLDKGEPKYLNSPETPLFQKGNELYGLFEARLAIRNSGYALVTEGYMDVVALAQYGFPQTVATLGTACSATHVQKLLRQTDSIIFSFDGDTAGRRAARRALEASLPFISDNKTIKFLFLPSEHDPDSYIREFGAPAFEQQINDAMPLSQFLLNEVIGNNDLNTSEGRARTQFDAKPLLQAMAPSALRLQIVRNLAQTTQTTASEIETLCDLTAPVARARLAPPVKKRQQPLGLVRQIMRLLVAHPILASGLDQSALLAAEQLAPAHADMLARLVTAGKEMGAHASFATLAEHLRTQDAEFDTIIAEIAADTESDIETAQLELADAVRKTKMQVLSAQLEQLVNSGLGMEEMRTRYRELTLQQEQLRRESSTGITPR